MLEYELIRSDRKTLSIEISADSRLIVRAPKRLSVKRIEAFLSEKREWIETHKEIAKKRAQRPERQPVDEEEAKRLCALAKEKLPPLVSYWSKRMGVAPTGVKITGAEKRFGSCSPANSLCFSYRLMRYPEDTWDYVVVHELAHIREHNHSKAFYDIVRYYLPDYKRREAILRGK